MVEGGVMVVRGRNRSSGGWLVLIWTVVLLHLWRGRNEGDRR
jgi:hypothetical protein